jgi:hypothetical protein
MPDPDATLFDPAPFTKGTPKAPRKRAPEPEAVTVTDCGWFVISKNGKGPVRHVHRLDGPTNPHGSVRTECRIVGRPLAEVEVGASA